MATSVNSLSYAIALSHIKAHAHDIGAGLCVAGILIPEAVAYASLANLSVVHAVTASMIGLLLYALAGTSRFAVVAPTSSTATLAAATAISLTGILPAEATPGEMAVYANAIFALVLCSGVLLVLLGMAHQGQLSAYVSRPVLRGFAFALALTIVIKQLPDALGFAVPAASSANPLQILLYTATHVQVWHPASLGIALGGALLLALIKRWPQLPASMLMMVTAIGFAYLVDLKRWGVHDIGLIQRPTFTLVWPDLHTDQWFRVGELAFGLVMLVFAESWGSVRTLALSHGGKLNANRELVVLGACNIGSALMQGMAVGAGFSASNANAQAGAQSRWAGFAALVVMALALTLALPYLHLLPRPILAVAVISALLHALSPRPLLTIWRMNRDRLLIVVAALAVLMLGVLDGLLAAIALSVLAALQRFSQPVVHELGQLGTTRNFVVIANHDDTAVARPITYPDILVLRPEEPLFFGSAERVMTEVLTRVGSGDHVCAVVLSLEESSDLDSTAVDCLLELNATLQKAGHWLLLARVKTDVRELLARWDPQGLGHSRCLYWSVADAVGFLQALTDHP